MTQPTALNPAASPQVPFALQSEVHIQPPPKLLLAWEARVVVEGLASFWRLRRARDLPRGDGHAVLVLPGFGMSDAATAPLRRALCKLGYAAHGWGQGRNRGMRSALKAALREKLERLSQQGGEPVSLIGWSLGGVFAREMARHQPALVRRVITLGSPINGRPDANNLEPLFRRSSGGRPSNLDWEGFQRRRTPPPVPCTAVYTRSDGIVAWPCCLEEVLPNTENVEVQGSHMGLVFNPQVLAVIAQRLARRNPAAQLVKN